METARRWFASTFRALRHRHFRLFWVGQWVSVTGTWMQTMAQSWLVYRLTDSPLTLGLLTAARFGPSLFGAPLAGVMADRFARRNLVLAAQALAMGQAAVLAALTLAGAVEVWHVLLLALLQGVIEAVDMPARQALQLDLVGAQDLQSAVSLNSVAFNAARMVGPALAGVLVVLAGEGVCFAANAASYLAVLLALGSIPAAAAVRQETSGIGARLLEGLHFVWHEGLLRRVLVAAAVTSLFGLSYITLLPVLARDVLGAGAGGYGALLGGAGLGAMAGALATASRRSGAGTVRAIAWGQAMVGVGLTALAASRRLSVALVFMVLIGGAVAVQLSVSNTAMQRSAPDGLRGRVISLYIWVFAGLAPVGGLAAGAVAEVVGAPWTAAACGAACALSALAVSTGAGEGG
jgi:MFS family permease